MFIARFRLHLLGAKLTGPSFLKAPRLIPNIPLLDVLPSVHYTKIRVSLDERTKHLLRCDIVLFSELGVWSLMQK
jgi:hypothetical protein